MLHMLLMVLLLIVAVPIGLIVLFKFGMLFISLLFDVAGLVFAFLLVGGIFALIAFL